MAESKRLFIGIVLCCLTIFLWHAVIVPNFIGLPPSSKPRIASSPIKLVDSFVDYDTAVSRDNQRWHFKNTKISGSFNLKRARIDDADLLDYRTKVDAPQHVKLLMPVGMENAYFIEYGWLREGEKVIPNSALWQILESTETTASLMWKNDLGVEFYLDIKLNEDYMFEIRQTVINKTNQPFKFNLYSRFNRKHPKISKNSQFQFEEVLGVFNQQLVEVKVSKLSSKPLTYDIIPTIGEHKWAAFSDKYWASVLIPPMDIEGKVEMQSSNSRTQLSFLSKDVILEEGEEVEFINHLFIGAKELHLLEKYNKSLNINLFDRLIDFGILYPITKPILISLIFLNQWLGNFGLSILVFVVLVKLALLPLDIRSKAGKQKNPQSQLQEQRLKELYKNDPTKLYKEQWALSRKNNPNFGSGCLAVLLQAPLLFGLYKLLNISIEMRHTPFYGWVHDLSAPDPTSVINFFGFIPWDLPVFLQIGVWPILFGLIIFIHQKLQMKNNAANEEIKSIMRALPYIIVFMMAQVPVGLVIYFTWSTLLSILQTLVLQSKGLGSYLARRSNNKPKLLR